MKNDYNVSVSASGGVLKRGPTGGSESESSYSQSMTVTTSLENDLKTKLSNFEYLKQKYLQGGAGGLDDVDDTSEEEDESESESKSTAKKKK
jgi:hypothetical protein